MKIIYPLVFLILAGCAAAPEKLESVGRAESARLARPTKRFSSYAAYELRPMVLSEAVKRDEAKVAAAGELEAVVRAKLRPLLVSGKQHGAANDPAHLLSNRAWSP